MKWFDDLPLRAKLMVNFVFSGGLLVLAIVVCYVQINRIQSISDELVDTTVPMLLQAGVLEGLRMRFRISSLDFMLADRAMHRQQAAVALEELDVSLRAELDKARLLNRSEAAQALLDEFGRSTAAYRNSVIAAVELVNSGRRGEAIFLQRNDWAGLADEVTTATQQMMEYANVGAARMGASSKQVAAGAQLTAVIALIMSTLVASLVVLLIARRIGGRLALAVNQADRIAAGRLELEAGEPGHCGRDEVGRLLEAMNRMRASLCDTIGTVRREASELAMAAESLGQGVGQLEVSIDAQSQETTNIAASVEQVTVSIGEVATRTNEASLAAQESDARAREGSQVLDRLAHDIRQVETVINTAAQGIGNLSQESKKISAIVNVIRDIADQTNLLALNAAIEAARAGKQGRGFAVVADEVRKLAERTAESTGEITAMVDSIQDSTAEVVTRIEEGVAAVERSVANAREADASIEALLQIAQRVSQLVGDIDLALREQSKASTAVARGVEQIANSSDQIHVVTTTTSRQADALNEIALRLETDVGRFSL